MQDLHQQLFSPRTPVLPDVPSCIGRVPDGEHFTEDILNVILLEDQTDFQRPPLTIEDILDDWSHPDVLDLFFYDLSHSCREAYANFQCPGERHNPRAIQFCEDQGLPRLNNLTGSWVHAAGGPVTQCVFIIPPVSPARLREQDLRGNYPAVFGELLGNRVVARTYWEVRDTIRQCIELDAR